MIYGGKFMIMTATLPRIYKDKLKEYNIDIVYDEFIKDIDRHKIKLKDKEIIDDVEFINKKTKNSKVLIIANTVNKSIEIYRKLNEIGVENINLLHSRFISKDKEKLEEEIKNFSNSENSGVWISTQIVEASLDIDFDYLFTEMSTLDSLFQRLGRCYRKREYKSDEANVYIYTENSSGIGAVYDRDIYHNSIELLSKYDGEILKEVQKIELVDKLYSEEYLYRTDFLENFEKSMKILDHMVDYELVKKEAQKILRNIQNIKVMPRSVYEENIDLIDQYKKCKQHKENKPKNQLRREIEKLVTNVRTSIKWKYGDRITNLVDDIYLIDLKYDKKLGLLIEKDEEYDIESRTL
ncbi:MAG: CRISPR-associated helicase Cas3' [Clostridia bacterium]|nr:CRISPR-associated helicase Cas3' [Clostridia bacterium]